MATRTARFLGWVAAAWAAILFLGAGVRALADCAAFGLPFTDLGSTSFCAQIAEAYDSGLTNGTSATTYSPSQNVSREQMAAFITRGLDQGLARGKRRTSLQQFWNGAPRWNLGFGLTTVGVEPAVMQSDGLDLWVPTLVSGNVYRVRASDGSVLAHWIGATSDAAVVVALGRVFVTGSTIPGSLYMIDPTAAPGAVTTVQSELGSNSFGIAFDGTNIWTANAGTGGNGGSVSIVTPGSSIPWSTTTVSAGFTKPGGAIFDGSNVWITDSGDNTLKKLDAAGGVLQSIPVGAFP